MVGRFVEEQHVGGFEQQLAQRHAAFLAAGKRGNIGLVGGAAQRFHRDIDLAVEIPEVLGVDLVLELGHFIGGFVGIVHRQFVVAVEHGLFLGHAQHDVAAHIEGGIKLGFLRQVAHARAFGVPSLALEILVPACHDLEQGRFTRAVDADDTDLHAGEEVEVDILKALLATGVGLGHSGHVIDVLIGSHGALLRAKSLVRGLDNDCSAAGQSAALHSGDLGGFRREYGCCRGHRVV